MNEFFQIIRQHVMAGSAQPLQLTWGELTEYDPTRHAGRFALPLYPDDATGLPIETGLIPIGTPYAGTGHGMQHPIETGTQALIAFMDGPRMLPVCASLMFNDVDNPPFPDGKTAGIKDAAGNVMSVKATDATHGTTTVQTAAGNKTVHDDTAGTITTTTATNNVQTQLDDLNKKISHITGTLSHVIDEVAKTVKQGTSTVYTIVDHTGAAISHVVGAGGKVGLGDLAGNLSAASNGAVNVTHLQAEVNALRSLARTDLQALCTAMVGAGVPSAGGVFALLAALTGRTVSNYSNTVLIK